MLLIRGSAGGTALTGTLYERGESPPAFKGAPDEGAPYVWVCDEFYEVESGGQVQAIDGQELHVAFETPMPRGFDERDHAIEAAKDHVRTQFARLGVDPDDVEVEVVEEGVVEEGVAEEGATDADATGAGAAEEEEEEVQ